MPKTPLVRSFVYACMILSLLISISGAAAAQDESSLVNQRHTHNKLDNKVEQPATEQPAIVWDPIVQTMIDQVNQDAVMDYDKQMAGEIPVWVDGAWYTIPTRYTNSGTPIQKATHWVGQHMQNDLGLDVQYHVWNNDTNPNVIGEIPGLTNPDDIFMIGAHIDDVSGAPGADDNGSGSVATLIAADILSQYYWGCTLRFAFWTGEEQGLLGSSAYAEDARAAGENIIGYLNLDMIAWNTIGSTPDFNLTYSPSIPGSQAFAQLFSDAVTTYGLDLVPHIGTLFSGSSDQASFWDYNYNSILVIEGNGNSDFNPYYHSAQDTPANTDPVYFTNLTKAALATLVHNSGCLIPSGLGALDGHVTSTDGGAPIEGVTVSIEDQAGHSFPTETDITGYYTQTLLTGAYTVTADLYGYYPETVPGVQVITDTVTTLDFALDPKPVYTVSGYVRDAATNAPLAATVEFTDAPVAPVTTDPVTGYYSIQVAEGNWTMKATAANHSPTTAEVDVTGNIEQDFDLFPICDALSDDVENGNIGWALQTPWDITAEDSHSPTHSWTDSPGGQYSSYRNISLTSPSLDLSGYTGIGLNFWHIYDTEPGYDYGYVEYSTDGGSTWDLAASYDGYGHTTWTQVSLPLEALDNQSNVKIRFRFQSDGSLTADGWHIDDITLTGGGSACVPPDIEVTPAAITKTLLTNETGSEQLVIANAGEGILELQNVTWESVGWLTLSDLPVFPVSLGPDGQIVLTLNFGAAGLAAGTYETLLTITSDDPVTPVIEVPVTLIVTETHRYFLPVLFNSQLGS